MCTYINQKEVGGKAMAGRKEEEWGWPARHYIIC